MRKIFHLLRRFFSSLSNRPVSGDDLGWVESKLLAGEYELWKRMDNHDRRHSLTVARRFVAFYPDFMRDHVAAALLHDVGKVRARLGVFGRVLATIIGPRGERFRTYHQHEILGQEMCRASGSSSETLRVLDWTTEDVVVAFLCRADDI